MIVCTLASCSWPFFFQAEDGIRAPLVTGVQTCALPIWAAPTARARRHARGPRRASRARAGRAVPARTGLRRSLPPHRRSRGIARGLYALRKSDVGALRAGGGRPRGRARGALLVRDGRGRRSAAHAAVAWVRARRG